MRAALDLASAATAWDDVPIGAVVLSADGEVIGSGSNVRERDGDPTGHAEMVAIREAATAVGEWRPTPPAFAPGATPHNTPQVGTSFRPVRQPRSISSA